ncbi:MAG: TetR/AcrR family transcriptional regulator [Alphaproteobacteria bacterium]|nr:TetR/AcrR family transcriptional regulator [Alphaproteobacteria bacterium]
MRPRDAQTTRAALISAATTLFNGPGYFATDSNAIARAAGYAPGSFYKHFSDKADVLLAVYESYVAAEWNGLRAAFDAGGSTRERLRRALEFIVDFHCAWAAFRTGIRAVARIEPAVARALGQSREKQLSLLAEATGLSVAKNGAGLLLTLSIVERLADTVIEGESADLRIDRAALLNAAERAILPLVTPG